MEEAILLIAEFIQEYRLWIIIISILIVVVRFINILNGLFDFVRNIKSSIIWIFKKLFLVFKYLFKSIKWFINIPIRMIERHRLKHTKFYVVPD